MLRLLTNDQLSEIHATSLEVLERVGIIIEEEKALNIVEAAGAIVDHSKRLARIPPYLIEEAIRKTPKSFLLGSRNLKHDLKIKNGSTHTRPGSGYTQILDVEADSPRKATLSDLRDLTVLTDSLENISFATTQILPNDVPTEISDVYAVRTALALTEKHLFFSPLSYANFKYCVKMAVAVRGSEEEFRKRPLVSFIAATTSPLRLMKEPALQLIECAKLKVPVMLDSSPMCGATAPSSLVGALVLQNAEDLAMNTLIQLVSANSPVTYGPRCTSLDMRTGLPSYGSVETALLSAAGVQVAHFYGLPADAHGPITNSTAMDEQVGLEKAISGMMPAIAGSEIVSGSGAIGDLNTSSIEQLVIDDEFYGMMFRFLKGVEFSEDALALDIIERVGHDSTYLKEEHTRRHYMLEHRLSTLFDRRFQRGSVLPRNVIHRAKEKAKKIISEHKPVPLELDVERQLDAILEDAKRSTK